MNILFVTTKGPLPLNDGHALRSFNLLQQVARVHNVHLVSFVKNAEEYRHAPQLQELCHSVQLIELPENVSKLALSHTLARSLLRQGAFVVRKYNSGAMRQHISRILHEKQIDIVHLDMLPLAVYMNDITGGKIILNEHNVESRLLARRVETENNPLRKWFYSQQHKQLELFERSAVRRADCVLACSDSDGECLKQLAATASVVTIPNGVDSDYFCPAPDAASEHDHNLIFVGGMNWQPNLDGLKWFDRQIFPHILKEFPQTKLHIIGQRLRVSWRHRDKILCHGYVDDIRPFMAKAAVVVVPLRLGSGTRLKILNAMAAGKAVVTTSIGAEGLEVSPGENILIADRAYHFARSVSSLLRNRDHRRQLGQRARQLIIARYQWRDIGNRLLSTYDQVHHQPKPAPAANRSAP